MDLNQVRSTIIKMFKLENLSPEEQDTVIQNIMARALENALMPILDGMSEADQEAYVTLTERDPAPDANEIIAFISAKAPNFEAELMEKLGEIYEVSQAME